MQDALRNYLTTDLRQFNQRVQDGAARNAAEAARLTPSEAIWRDKQRFLQSKGYMLRPRYHPDWIPSWTLPENAHRFPHTLEDYKPLHGRRHLMDATRMSDGRTVYIKRVETDGQEIRIASMLSSAPATLDSRNHSVPLLDAFQDDIQPHITYMVMPFLRLIDEPPFETVKDVVDFVDQLLEGLEFMHEQGVAHRDCAYKNIMMDADALYSERCHPIFPTFDWNLQRQLTPRPRSKASIRYYYIDYGISTYFAPGQPRGLVTGVDGHDEDVPELSDDVPYDPFKVDIFIIGNMLRTMFYHEYANVEFLASLIQAMTVTDANDRVDATRAYAIWSNIRSEISFSRFRRLRLRTELWSEALIRDGISFIGHGAQAGADVFNWLSEFQG